MLKENYTTLLSTLVSQAKTGQTAVDHLAIVNNLAVTFGEHIDSYRAADFASQLQSMDTQTAILIEKIVIIQCALNNWQAIFHGDYTDAIMAQYQKTFTRFFATCETESGWGGADDDVYWKDLAMARRLLFPAGAQVVETSSGYGINQGINSNLLASIKFAWLALKQGGTRGYYQIHTHTPELSEFNPDGWNQCYLRIAQMLEQNPDIKGIFGGSWFYDPQLKDISPRLMYLQQVPLDNGASSFFTGNDHSGNAINKSKTRLDLHKQGKYTPKSYLLIWPRAAMIRWANEFKNTQSTQTVAVP